MRPRDTHTAGLSPVVVVLSASLLLAATLLLTTQLALSAQRGAVSQAQLLTAQYAAESGVNRGMYRLATIQQALQGSNLDFAPLRLVNGVTKNVPFKDADFAAMALAFCNGGTTTTTTVSAADQKIFDEATSRVTCTPPATSTAASRFEVLARLMNANGYVPILRAQGFSAEGAANRAKALVSDTLENRLTWWNTFLSPAAPDAQSGDINYQTNVSVRNYRLETYKDVNGLVKGYRFYFKSNLTSTGSQQGTDAARVLSPATAQDRNGIYWLDIRPMRVRGVQFRFGLCPDGVRLHGQPEYFSGC